MECGTSNLLGSMGDPVDNDPSHLSTSNCSRRSAEMHSMSSFHIGKINTDLKAYDHLDGINYPVTEDTRCEAPSPSRTSPQPQLPPDAVSTPSVSSFANVLDYRYEANRLKSLQKWPAKNFMNLEETAKSGLYYFGECDKVRCQFCRVVLSQWKEGDDADTDHSRWSRSCPLLLNQPVGNVPLTDTGADECGIYENKSPKHPAYMTEVSRLETFRNWPSSKQQDPQALADAGFYYAGSLDQTVCYYCGGGLKDWEDDDDPWEQHALWFTRCSYLRLVKGEEFINKVLKAKASPEEIPASPDQTVTITKPAKQVADCSEDKACKICMVNERNTCFIPCGHVVACPKCAMSVSTCPICRKEFTTTVKIYFS